MNEIAIGNIITGLIGLAIVLSCAFSCQRAAKTECFQKTQREECFK
jgi:hypothetical protein